MSVRVDPKSGLKVFATRAAKASEKITGKGYSTVSDESLKTLPPAPAGAVFDAVSKRIPRFKEARAGAADTWPWRANSVVTWYVYSAEPVAREALPTNVT